MLEVLASTTVNYFTYPKNARFSMAVFPNKYPRGKTTGIFIDQPLFPPDPLPFPPGPPGPPSLPPHAPLPFPPPGPPPFPPVP
jgi:hypothetical protein